jgi:hypothetical protein
VGGFNREVAVDEEDQGEHPQQTPKSQHRNAYLTVGDDIRGTIGQRTN